MLVLARCAGFVFRAPGFAHPAVPSTLRAGFALVLALAIAPGIRAPQLQVHAVAFVAVVMVEFLIGSAIGMTASLVYDGAYAGGRVVDDYVGVKAIAPSLQLVAPSGFGRIWSLLFTGAFFLTGAYRIALLGLRESFVAIPLGTPLQAAGWTAFAGSFAASIVTVALVVAAPAVGLAFVVQIALGAVSRVVPRFGSFTLTFPLAYAAALIATAIAMPYAAQRVPPPLLAIPGTR